MARPHRKLATLLLLASCTLAPACRRPPAPLPVAVPKPAPAPPANPRPVTQPELPLLAPRTSQPIALDGELSESVWRAATHSGGFSDEKTGLLAVPHSELRLANDGTRILLGLYAADEDIVAAAAKPTTPTTVEEDAFEVQIQRPGVDPPYQLWIWADGERRQAGVDAHAPTASATCAIEMDGTLNKPDDDDEEWVAECMIPFTAIGARVGDTLAITVRRCDTPKIGGKRCGVWHGRAQLQ